MRANFNFVKKAEEWRWVDAVYDSWLMAHEQGKLTCTERTRQNACLVVPYKSEIFNALACT